MLGDDLTVKFTAFESVKMSDSKILKHQDHVLKDALGKEIVKKLLKDSGLNQRELEKKLQTLLPSIQRYMNKLKESGCIVCKGGKRFRYWKINQYVTICRIMYFRFMETMLDSPNRGAKDNAKCYKLSIRGYAEKR